MSKAISVIILSYNTQKITDECLSRVKEASEEFKKKLGKEVEVMVLDNASNDGSAEMITKKYPWVELVKSSTNTGFAKGNNLMMKKAKGDYFLLLNSDAFFSKSTLVTAWQKIEKGRFDVLACRLNFQNGSLQPSAGALPNLLNITTWMFGLGNMALVRDVIVPVHAKNKNYFANEKKIGWAMGAFMFLKREVFEKTGGFDENFFMYTEEVEWYKRIYDAGFKVIYSPDFSIVHLDKSSSGGSDVKAILAEKQGLLYYAKKHLPKSVWYVRALIYFGSIWRMILFMALGRKEKAGAHKMVLLNL